MAAKKEFWTLKEIGEFCNLSERTMARIAASGHIKCYRGPRSQHRATPEDFAAFLAEIGHAELIPLVALYLLGLQPALPSWIGKREVGRDL